MTDHETFLYPFKNKRIGFLTNHSCLSDSGYPNSLAFKKNGFNLVRLFTPEHGLSAQGEDGKAQPNGIDPLTGVPMISLYGDKIKPSPLDLQDLDVVIMDLPNIGCRFYTYFWSLTLMVEACAQSQIQVVFLDHLNLRSNNPRNCEGPILNEKLCSSFLGRWEMPLTHGFTYGELLQWFIHEKKISVSFENIPSSQKNWNCQDHFIPVSPSMDERQTVLLYPMTCLFEGLNINYGRGTSFPFKVIGASWLNSIVLFENFNNQKFPGIQAFPYTYLPQWGPFQGIPCHGLFFHVTDANQFQPVKTGIWLINHIHSLYPDLLVPAAYPSTINPTGDNHLDYLLGIPNAFDKICQTNPENLSRLQEMDKVSEWVSQVNSFLKK